MNNLLSMPTEQELDWLDVFFLNRIDDEHYQEGMDEGIFDLSTLDGFFAAIVSGPEAILPSQWLPEIWGDFEPEWKSEAEAEKVISLLIRFINGVSTFLMQAPEDYEPMFVERESKGKVYWVVDEWCEGYIRGVNLNAEQWQTDSRLIQDNLAPVLAFTEQGQFFGHELETQAEVELLQQSIKPNILAIHAHWLAQRNPLQENPKTVRYDEPRPGRNDLCPCGSGKKYKKCCLN